MDCQERRACYHTSIARFGSTQMQEKIGVIGLGYVGLPLLAGLAKHYDSVVGFDIDKRRVDTLRAGEDWTGEVERGQLAVARKHVTDDPGRLSSCTFLIVTTPTPIDDAKRPDLELRQGQTIVLEVREDLNF